jgi:hypothetical protein
VRTDAEIKQTVIAILTAVRGEEVDSEADLFTVQGTADGGTARQAAEQAGRQALTAATYAMTLFHMLAAEFEAACPGVDVQAFLRRRALEVAAEDDEAA